MTRRQSLLISTVLLFALAATACGTDGQTITEETLAPKTQSTKIFASDGSLITTLRQEENRELLPIEEIPRHVRDAVVAIEDARFYTHKGVDAKAIMRAIYTNASTGQVIEGGSTITQQLVRNSIQEIGRARTLERKLKEASYAYQVDNNFTKDKILELYLNTVYFGDGAYGIQTAAQTYFGKSAKDLTLAEAALLAGMIKSPVNFNPYTNADASLARRNRVLDRMFINEFARAADVGQAKGQPLGVRQKTDLFRYPAPYFIDYVTRLIQHSDDFEDLGESVAERANRLFRGGLRIHTTLDMKMQAAAEEAIARVLDRPDEDPSAALVAIEPKSGHLRALVGGRDFFADEQDDPCVKVGAVNADGSPNTCAKVNLALGRDGGGTGRQPGSAFKPFVLAAAIDDGMRLDNKYQASSCIDIPDADAGGTKPWHVCNYEDSAFGSVSVLEATQKSINTVYAQIIRDLGEGKAYRGAAKVVETAQAMGIRSDLNPVPSVALGSPAVSPLDMASAFSVLPNLGVRVEPIAITKITDSRGELIWEPDSTRNQVLNAGVAYLVTQALEGVINQGTGSRARIGRPAFGKTGTAQEWRDAWFVGGAGTDLVASVAVFWPDGEIEMKPACDGPSKYELVRDASGNVVAIPPACRPTRIRVAGGTWPAQIWQIFMLKAMEGIPASTFAVPEVELVKIRVDATRSCLPNPYTPPDIIKTETFIKGTEPTDVCTEPAGPASATVPGVVGHPESLAIKTLQGAGFNVDKKTEPSRLYPPGTVARQSPEPGVETSPGSTVTIWISTSAEARVVPDVVNMSESGARKALEDAGFKVKIIRQGGCKANDDKCIVKDQDPDGGKRAPAGSEVTIWMGPKS
jgi:penicillin-binding protein 1A